MLAVPSSHIDQLSSTVGCRREFPQGHILEDFCQEVLADIGLEGKRRQIRTVR